MHRCTYTMRLSAHSYFFFFFPWFCPPSPCSPYTGKPLPLFSHLFVLFSFSSTHVAYPTADVCIALVSKSKTYSPQKSLRISVLCVCHFQGRHVVPCTSLLVWSGSVSGGWRSRKTLRLSFGDEPCLTICFFRKGSLIVFGPVIMLSGDPPGPAAGLRERGAEGEGGRRCSLEARYFFFATNSVCFVVLTRRFSTLPACVLTHLRTQTRVRAPFGYLPDVRPQDVLLFRLHFSLAQTPPGRLTFFSFGVLDSSFFLCHPGKPRAAARPETVVMGFGLKPMRQQKAP